MRKRECHGHIKLSSGVKVKATCVFSIGRIDTWFRSRAVLLVPLHTEFPNASTNRWIVGEFRCLKHRNQGHIFILEAIGAGTIEKQAKAWGENLFLDVSAIKIGEKVAV